ncbi:MAG: diguanylate cyclase [Thermodesulfobacteriota bacterium]|nr:diguanylate cyclase [Thermodesulfobacteriota bacterium]
MRSKLNLGFLAIILLLWAICVYSVVSSIEVRRINFALKDEIVPGAIEMANIKFEAIRIKSITLSYIIRGNVLREGQTIKQKLFKAHEDLKKNVQNHFEHGCHVGLGERQAAEKIKSLAQKLIPISVEIATLKDSGVLNDQLFKKIKEEFRPVFILLRDAVNKHAQEHAERMAAAEIELQNKHNAHVGSVAVLGILATLLALFVGFMVDKNFSRYIFQRNLAEEELRKSEKRFKVQFQGFPIPTYIWRKSNGDFVLFGYNKAAHDMTQGKIKDWINAKLNELFIDSPEIIEELHRCYEEKRILRREVFRLMKTTGEQKYFDVTHVFLPPNTVMTHTEDITERKQAEEELRRKEERLGLALRGGDLGIWDWDIQTDEVRFNERWVGMKGYSLRELEPRMKVWEKLMHPEDLPGVREKLKAHLEGETSFYEAEFRMRHKSGEWVWILDKGRVIEWDEDDHPVRACGTHLDITERKKAEEKILHMANHDPLTGLPSLRLAKDRIFLAMGLASRHKTMAAVMFMDLDEFKKVNDGFGHDAGDALLKEMAGRFLSCVREVDTVARVGGDEFLLIASDLSTKDDAAKIAGKVIQRVGEPFTYNGNQLNVGVSIGIALCPDNGKEAEILIRKADDAMYAAKKFGRNRFVFSDVVD